MKFSLLCCLIILFSCNRDSESISFSILQNGEITEISKVKNKEEFSKYKELITNSNFSKLLLSQVNKDNLIVENNEDGYWVLVKIRYEQFVIETPLVTIEEVIDIMTQYIVEKDRIMEKTKFN